MANATAFMTPWGYDKLLNNQSDIIGASLDVWRYSGAQSLAMDFTFGFIPIILLTIIYIRTKKIDLALFVGLLSTLGLKGFNLISPYTSQFMWIAMAIGLGLSLTYKFFNKT